MASKRFHELYTTLTPLCTFHASDRTQSVSRKDQQDVGEWICQCRWTLFEDIELIILLDDCSARLPCTHLDRSPNLADGAYSQTLIDHRRQKRGRGSFSYGKDTTAFAPEGCSLKALGDTVLAYWWIGSDETGNLEHDIYSIFIHVQVSADASSESTVEARTPAFPSELTEI